ncbi:hypothetical protein KP509_30G071800 [Ceratopteris richardii]|uniref:W2 domain-containing protein n=1 Tax=Ceratopteris richardii TaxID=49495 RepID=A0A8T2R4Q2_CERRI|nr:hypothetical protein KP509_30G071800 [Ceratopteris richardii]
MAVVGSLAWLLKLPLFQNKSNVGFMLQVVYTGGRIQFGSTKPEEGERQPYCILNSEASREKILPYVLFIQKIIRRRPFMIKSLENVMQRLLQSLELYGQIDRLKLAIFTALTFSQKLSGLPPENIFSVLLKDSLVAKGTVLGFITDCFNEYLVENSFDDLIALLKRAKIEDRLLEFFPMQKRTMECFSEHFSKAGLIPLVEYNEKKVFDVKLKELRNYLADQFSEDVNMDELMESLKQRCKEASLPDAEVVRTVWEALMDAIQWSGKNQQQNVNLALRQVKTWGALLGSFTNTGKLELELIYTIQTYCYEDAKLMKLFPEIIRALYEKDVLAEDTILFWFKKGSNPKGRQIFVKGLEPFVKWLEEAEEED